MKKLLLLTTLTLITGAHASTAAKQTFQRATLLMSSAVLYALKSEKPSVQTATATTIDTMPSQVLRMIVSPAETFMSATTNIKNAFTEPSDTKDTLAILLISAGFTWAVRYLNNSLPDMQAHC